MKKRIMIDKDGYQCRGRKHFYDGFDAEDQKSVPVTIAYDDSCVVGTAKNFNMVGDELWCDVDVSGAGKTCLSDGIQLRPQTLGSIDENADFHATQIQSVSFVLMPEGDFENKVEEISDE